MIDDESEPRSQKGKPKSLENMSVGELENYIDELKAEILRVEDDIKKKKAHQETASSLFKS